tara:strand:+ start:362 stop:538 length:177 start_codon:yes stop_codon:yes gene_type:complete
MSKHEVLRGITYTKGKSTIRLGAGDVLDSTTVRPTDLKWFIMKGAVGPALVKKEKGGG